MHLPMFQVDAFTNSQFKGNPAAVVVLEKKISANLMQQIAFENNLSVSGNVVCSEVQCSSDAALKTNIRNIEE